MYFFFWFYLLFAQDAAFLRAIEMQQAGDLAGAVSQYRAVIAGDPRRFDARSNLGAVFSKLGRYPEAIEQYEEALRSAPAEFAPRLRYNLALGYYKSFQIAKAEGELARLHGDNPGDWNATLLLADCELRLGQFQKVRELLLPLEAGRTGDLALTYLLGMALIRGGDPEGGQRRIDAILKAGDSAEARFLLASAMFMARDYPAAVKGFERAIALNPSLPELQAYYGQALLYTGDAAGASEAFQKELKQNPNNFEATLGLGQILEQRGRKAEAAGLLRRAAELRPGVTIAVASAGAVGSLAVGSMAPRFAALGLEKAGRPTVLVFGSYSCPQLRGSADAVARLADRYKDRVRFLLVYIKEAHAAGQWESSINEREGVAMGPAKTLAEKEEHAVLCTRKLKLPFAHVTDGMDGQMEAAYQAWPSRVYVVGRDGRVVFQSGLGEQDFRAEALEGAVRKASAF